MSEHKALTGFHDWRTARHREASRRQWPPPARRPKSGAHMPRAHRPGAGDQSPIIMYSAGLGDTELRTGRWPPADEGDL